MRELRFPQLHFKLWEGKEDALSFVGAMAQLLVGVLEWAGGEEVGEPRELGTTEAKAAHTLPTPTPSPQQQRLSWGLSCTEAHTLQDMN